MALTLIAAAIVSLTLPKYLRNDPTFLEQLVKSSVKVTLRDGETTTQNHRMGEA